MEKKNKSYLAALIERLFSDANKNFLVRLLEKQAIKELIKKFVGISGIKLWLISFVVEEIIEEVDDHVIEPIFRRFNLIPDIIDGKTVYRKVENAEDRTARRDALRDA